MFLRFSVLLILIFGLMPRAIAQNVASQDTRFLSEKSSKSLRELRNAKATISVSDDALSQINAVDQLRDVNPNDWAYEALKSLVERYGCIVGYPDSTFRGNRALSRWEFAAGLNACLNTMEKLLQEM